MHQAQALRERLKGDDLLLAMGAWDVLSSKIIERAGYDVAALQSFQYAAGSGLPDIGLRTASDILEVCFKIAGEIQIPLLVDVEEGFGGAPNAAYWARELERAGVAAIHIDDLRGLQCPFLPSRLESCSAEETADRIAAIVDARQEGLVIIARTLIGMANPELGEDEEYRRLHMYREAGADVIWAPFIRLKVKGDIEGLRRAVREFDAPIFLQSNPPGFFPGEGYDLVARMDFAELKREGVRIFCCPQVYPVAYRALWEGLDAIKAAGNLGAIADRMLDLDTVLDVTGYKEVERLRARGSARDRLLDRRR